MEILKFEIIDLGAAPIDTVCPGDSFREDLDAAVMGTGNSASAAMKNALDQLALDGLGTKLLHESAIEDGWYGLSAAESAANLYEAEEDEEPDQVIEYHVLIRFQDPAIEEDEE